MKRRLSLPHDMNRLPIVDVIIPAFNEAPAMEQVVTGIRHPFVRHVVVVDNGSTDRTAEIAAAVGALVFHEERRGYGYACLKGIEVITNHQPPPDFVVFMDGDFSDDADEMAQLIEPLVHGAADLVIGSRAAGHREKGSMTVPQVFGNWLATRMIHILFGFRFTDLGPFRALRTEALCSLGMRDKTYGWTVEMQVRALRKGLRCTEVPVSYRRRIGTSKVSGTIKGSILAGYKIITTILIHSLRP